MLLTIYFISKKISLFVHFQLYKLYFGSRNLDNSELEFVQRDDVVCFRDALILMKNQATNGLVFVAFGEFE